MSIVSKVRCLGTGFCVRTSGGGSGVRSVARAHTELSLHLK